MGNWQQFMLSKKEQFPRNLSFAPPSEDEIYRMLFFRSLNLILNRFIWDYLPDDIPPWFVESTFLYQGSVCVWHDSIVDKHIISPVVLEGGMDVYGLLENRHIICPNGVNAYRTKDDSVVIWDTYNNFPSYPTIQTYCKILTRIASIYLKNIDMQRKSIAVIGTQDELLTTRNLIKEITDGVEYIPIKRGFDLNDIKPLNLSVGYCAADLRLQFKENWNDLLNTYGIESYSSDKKERLISAEGEGGIGAVEIARNSFLNPRVQGLEKTKEMFPKFKDTTVRFNSMLDTRLNIPFLKEIGLYEEPEVNADG